jgi:hypothetical protein
MRAHPAARRVSAHHLRRLAATAHQAQALMSAIEYVPDVGGLASADLRRASSLTFAGASEPVALCEAVLQHAVQALRLVGVACESTGKATQGTR